jgi:hypothetical protein
MVVTEFGCFAQTATLEPPVADGGSLAIPDPAGKSFSVGDQKSVGVDARRPVGLHEEHLVLRSCQKINLPSVVSLAGYHEHALDMCAVRADSLKAVIVAEGSDCRSAEIMHGRIG